MTDSDDNLSELDEKEQQIVDSHARMLFEHFDNVQILVSRYTAAGGTHWVEGGRGNIYARAGQAKRWLRRMNRELDEQETKDE